MNKLLSILCLSAILLSGCVCKKDNPLTKNNNPRFWTWVHSNNDYTTEDWEKSFAKMKDIGFQAILYSGGAEKLKEIIPIANKYGIEVHKWMWTMNSPGIEKEHPEWLSVNRNGKSLSEEKAYVGYYKFMCPSLPEVQEYLKKKVENLAKIKGLKGIHLDYIRYVDVILPKAIQPDYNIVQDHEFPEYDYGYHPHTREMYKKKYGIDPMDIKDPENDKNWKQFRYDLISNVVSQLKDVAHKYNKEITAAVFPSPTIARKLVRQDWDKWPIDYFFPMVYQGFYYGDMQWVENTIKEGIAANKGKDLFCGLYLPQLKDGDLTKAIDSAFKAGASGIAIFEFNGVKGDIENELREAFKKYSN